MKKYLIWALCVATIVFLSFFGQKYVALVRTARVAEADVKLTRNYGTKAESEAALLKNPRDLKGLRGMVYAYQLEHNREKAWQWMQKDLQAEPNNPYTQFMYALMLNDYKNKPDEALVILDRLTTLKNTGAAESATVSANKIRKRRGAL